MMTQTNSDYSIQPVPFTQVQIRDKFWLPRIITNNQTTIPDIFHKCETTGRIDNFSKAGGLLDGAYEGLWFNDSDVFKVIEGAAYALQTESDPELEQYLDELIAKIAAAQETDGYLYTPRTIDPDHVPDQCGPQRWSNLVMSHELYNVGHMYEAAVAYYQSTGKDSLLKVAIRNADLIVSTFGPQGIRDVPGHQEIEIGLVRLALTTKNQEYLSLAQFFLDERGYAHERLLGGEYNQDHLPVREQREAVGHAVRAVYMYAAMADVATLTQTPAYIDAIMALWHNVVQKKLALTGGIGARHEGEAFGANYELPNLTAYNETCAAIANIFWNHRLFLLTGESKYIDVLERTLYNGFLSGVDLTGKVFFYVNPLACDGEFHFNSDNTLSRQEWFNCSCCPTNAARFFPSLSGYIYSVADDALYVNLYVANEAHVQIRDTEIRIVQHTEYPKNGRVKLAITATEKVDFSLRIRQPGWASRMPVPSDLYHYTKSDEVLQVSIRLDGETITPDLLNGYFVITRSWAGTCEIEIEMPMPVQRVVANDSVQDLIGKVALERGPMVYALEQVDNSCDVFDVILGDDELIDIGQKRILSDDVVTLTCVVKDESDDRHTIEAIPYYVWGHRGTGKMTVWLNRG